MRHSATREGAGSPHPSPEFLLRLAERRDTSSPVPSVKNDESEHSLHMVAPSDSAVPLSLDATQAEDRALISALLHGDEAAFLGLVRQLHGPMIRFARAFLPTRELAEEAVQQTWVEVLRGLHRFQFRSRLRTWIFGILLRQSKRRANHEKRHLQRLQRHAGGDLSGAVGYPVGASTDAQPTPEQALLRSEVREVVRAAVSSLPNTQRLVVTLRDIEGWTSAEVCQLLRITDANQRVLLHRARLRIRAQIRSYIDSPSCP